VKGRRLLPNTDYISNTLACSDVTRHPATDRDGKFANKTKTYKLYIIFLLPVGIAASAEDFHLFRLEKINGNPCRTFRAPLLQPDLTTSHCSELGSLS
jgi:hypothetical protein